MAGINSAFAAPLICFAVRSEAAGFRRICRDPAAELLLTGMGKANAESALRRRLQQQPAPSLVISAGFAGGLNPRWPVAAVLFETNLQTGGDIIFRAGAQPARFCSSDRVLAAAQEKAARWAETGADALDMESAGIRAVCAEAQAPWAIVRAISDAADGDLPLDFNRFIDVEKRFQYGKLAGYLAARPAVIFKILRFRRDVRRASERLGQALAAALSLAAESE